MGLTEIEVRVRHLMDNGPLSDRARTLRDVFGVDTASGTVELDPVIVSTTGLTLITGFSGTGKSSVLRELRRRTGAVTVADLAPVGPTDRVVDLFTRDVDETVSLLGRFGLGEPRLMMSRPATLSDGQAHRLTLARLADTGADLVMVDEFCSNLDRTTAKVIAHNFQRVFRSLGLHAVVATAHDDLAEFLCPDRHILLDFDGTIRTVAPDLAPGTRITEWIGEEFTEGPGTRADYERLAGFHYRSDDERWIDWTNLVAEVRTVRAGEMVVAVKVFCRPFPREFESLPTLRRVNEAVLFEERVIVHPAFRGLSLNSRMWPASGTRVLIAQSALGRSFPFHLKAGYRRVDHPSETPAREQFDLVEVLRRHAPDLNTSATEAIRATLSTLTPRELDEVRAATARAVAVVNARHIRFLAELSGVDAEPEVAADVAAVTSAAAAAVADADADSLAILVETATPFKMAGFVRDPAPKLGRGLGAAA